MKNTLAKLILLSIFGWLGCNQSIDGKNSTIKEDKTIIEKKPGALPDKTYLLKNMNGNSFVLSCGSGCAMRYIAKQINGNKSIIKVQFSVEMFEDEQTTDNYFETYFFYYSNTNKLLKIIREGETESFLETQMPNAQLSFKNFGDQLILKIDSTSTKISNQ